LYLLPVLLPFLLLPLLLLLLLLLGWPFLPSSSPPPFSGAKKGSFASTIYVGEKDGERRELTSVVSWKDARKLRTGSLIAEIETDSTGSPKTQSPYIRPGFRV
jgi:hypothetical protein